MKQTRKLKIQPKIILRSYDKTIVPEILLKGKWLEEAGFKPGQRVQIEQRKINSLLFLLPQINPKNEF